MTPERGVVLGSEPRTTVNMSELPADHLSDRDALIRAATERVDAAAGLMARSRLSLVDPDFALSGAIVHLQRALVLLRAAA